MPTEDTKVALEILLQTLKENPELWETRKKTAKLLYAEERYLESANIIWNAPEIPSTDVDVAFVLKMISRVKPNRSIRLIYEVVRRNQNKPHKNMAVAKALNNIGMHMEAARFYGAALADDSSLFDLGFERQMLWLDDSERLLEEWLKTDQEAKPPLDVPEQNISGGMITSNTIDSNIEGHALGETPPPPPQQAANPSEQGTLTPPPVRQATNPLLKQNTGTAANPQQPPSPVATQPLMVNPAAGIPTQTPPVATQPLAMTPQLAQPAPIATQPLAMAPQLGQPNPIATQPLAMAPQLAQPNPIATQPLAMVHQIPQPAPLGTQPLNMAPQQIASQPLAMAPPQQVATQPLTSASPYGQQPMQPMGYAPLPLQPGQPPLPHNPNNPYNQQQPAPPQQPNPPKFKLK